MSIKEDQTIFDGMYRIKYDDCEYYFEEIIKMAILKTLTEDPLKAEAMAASKVNRLWTLYKKKHFEDLANGITPLFSVISEYEKKVRWIGERPDSNIGRSYFKIRPDLYRYFDTLGHREYEVIACVICELLGADKICLTPKGNEGGVDFFARIPFSKKSHFMFGRKGPIRIVGQCKKYVGKDNIGNMKEFVTTLNNVYNKSFRVGEILPEWFKMEKGDIIGWHISNMGHQTGALDVAKNYGILVSDTEELIEIICCSKVIRMQREPMKYLKSRMNEENFTS